MKSFDCLKILKKSKHLSVDLDIYESTKCGDPSIELLYLFLGTRMLHVDDSLYFLEIDLDSSLGRKKSEELLRSYSECILCRIQLNLISSKCAEGFF